MKELTFEQRRISLRPLYENRPAVIDEPRKQILQRMLAADEAKPLSYEEKVARLAEIETQMTKLDGDVGGKKPASKNGPMLWRPQLELEQEAWTRFDQVDAQMDLLVTAISRELDGFELTQFQHWQRAFERQRDLISTSKAKSKGGGSAGKLIRATVAEEMTRERLAELEKKLESLAPDYRQSVLIEVLTENAERSKESPKLISIWSEVMPALSSLWPHEEKHPALEAGAQMMRALATEVAYFQWKHGELDDAARTELLGKVEQLQSAGSSLLAALDETPGLGVEAKEAYSQLLDVLSMVDGVVTRLTHGKAP